MATRLIGVDDSDPRLPDVVMAATEASDAQAIAGTDDSSIMTPRRAAVIAEKYDVRRSGAAIDGTTDDSAALADAALVIATAGGGIGRIPIGTTRLDSVVTLPNTRVALVGDDAAGSRIEYHGSGAAFDITSTAQVRLENLRIVNTGGTGTHGIIVGPSASSPGWKHELRRIDLTGFLTNGLYVANAEQCVFEQVYVDGDDATSVGVLVNAARHTTTAAAVGNRFDRCRVYNCNSFGWDINNQIGAKFEECQSLSNAGTYQVQIRGTTYNLTIEAFDLEDVLGAAASSGIIIAGESHSIDVNCFSLNKGVEFSAATGCLLGPSRFSTVATPLTVGSTCRDLLIFDGGNLGTISEAAPSETHYVGQRIRSNRLEVSGTAGTGYIDFRDEQSADPAAAANRGRLFIKDNGSGKTQLCVRFGSGATQVIATEP